MADQKNSPRRFRIFRYADWDIKQTFLLFLIIGFIGIFISRGFGPLPSIIIPCLSMIIYVFITQSSSSKFIRNEQLGDSCYYMGFLLTLVSLGFALYEFSTDPENDSFGGEILADFGIALSTTILGLMFRVYYSQFRLPAEELRQTAEDELAATVRRLKIQLDTGIDSFEKFEVKIQDSIQESLKSTTINYQEYLNKALENFSTSAQEILKSFKETADEQFKLKEKFQSLNNELTSVNSQTSTMSKQMLEFNESLKNITTYFSDNESKGLLQMTESISKFTESLKNQVEIISNQEVKLRETLTNTNKRREEIEKEVERAELVLKDVYTTLTKMTDFVKKKIDK
ncbi:hypothetical protein OAQ96_01640 [Alphaproteobacteria bacterium]|nr:hypothetical protein [Alphaproteobacteria bacterium]